MDWSWHTVALTEAVWTALCLWGAQSNARIWRAIDADVDLLEAGVVPATPGALALFRNDRATEADWMVMFAILSAAGIVQMLAHNQPRDEDSWITVLLLFAAIIWVRWRSEVRGKRRAHIKATARAGRDR